MLLRGIITRDKTTLPTESRQWFGADNFLFPANDSGDPARIAVLLCPLDCSSEDQSTTCIQAMKGRSSRLLDLTKKTGLLERSSIDYDLFFAISSLVT